MARMMAADPTLPRSGPRRETGFIRRRSRATSAQPPPSLLGPMGFLLLGERSTGASPRRHVGKEKGTLRRPFSSLIRTPLELAPRAASRDHGPKVRRGMLDLIRSVTPRQRLSHQCKAISKRDRAFLGSYGLIFSEQSCIEHAASFG
jgi:hypothetical protein